MWQTPATEHLGITTPIVQAPMGGGPSTPSLVAAVSNAGGLGSLAGGYLGPDQLRADIRAVRSATSAPFAVNLFVPTPVDPNPEELDAALRRVGPLRTEVGLPARPAPPTVYAVDFDEQLEVVLSERPPVVSFTFGLLEPGVVESLHGAGCLLVGTATTVAEAVALVESGSDLVCAQGAEAGAHRGSFLGEADASVVGTMALVPQVCDAVAVPVIAAGGIMDGRGVAAALALGAGAAQLGTAFLRCPEAGTHPSYRRALRAAGETSTRLTRGVTGRLARGIDNRLIRALESTPVPPYPVMHTLTAELRRQAAERDMPELMALWCGQGVRLGTELPAAQLTTLLDESAATVAEALGRLRLAVDAQG